MKYCIIILIFILCKNWGFSEYWLLCPRWTQSVSYNSFKRNFSRGIEYNSKHWNTIISGIKDELTSLLLLLLIRYKNQQSFFLHRLEHNGSVWKSTCHQAWWLVWSPSPHSERREPMSTRSLLTFSQAQMFCAQSPCKHKENLNLFSK